MSTLSKLLQQYGDALTGRTGINRSPEAAVLGSPHAGEHFREAVTGGGRLAHYYSDGDRVVLNKKATPMTAREVQAKHELAQGIDRGGNHDSALTAISRVPQSALADLLSTDAPLEQTVARAASGFNPLDYLDGKALSKHLADGGPLPTIPPLNRQPIRIPGGRPRKMLRGPQYR